MKYFSFVLKTAGISCFISSLIGILGGLVWSKESPLHAHFPVPSWLITLILAACTSLFVGILVGSMLSFLGKANLPKAILYTVIIVVIFLIAFLTYVINV
ncbi:hypothetical protein V9L05_03885 [Bernardetia sp. Wsw4-3y2]|uniref:hypothetical protein n=1 Tax=Bernardetia sp. Wsw4-3y2 TaxID=3127471 RepID=UPI0030CBA48B